MKSNTYNMQRVKRAYQHLAESSTDVMDYRSRLIFLEIAKKHPTWDPSLLKAISDTRAMFYTIFQRPIEWFMKIRMKWILRRVQRKCKH